MQCTGFAKAIKRSENKILICFHREGDIEQRKQSTCVEQNQKQAESSFIQRNKPLTSDFNIIHYTQKVFELELHRRHL